MSKIQNTLYIKCLFCFAHKRSVYYQHQQESSVAQQYMNESIVVANEKENLNADNSRLSCVRQGLWPGMPLYRTVSDRGLWKKNRTKEVGLFLSPYYHILIHYPIHLLRPSCLISLFSLKPSQDPAPQHFHKPNYIDKARPQVTYSQVCAPYLQ